MCAGCVPVTLRIPLAARFGAARHHNMSPGTKTGMRPASMACLGTKASRGAAEPTPALVPTCMPIVHVPREIVCRALPGVCVRRVRHPLGARIKAGTAWHYVAHEFPTEHSWGSIVNLRAHQWGSRQSPRARSDL